MVFAEYPYELVAKLKELFPHDKHLHKMLDANSAEAWDKLSIFYESFISGGRDFLSWLSKRGGRNLWP